MNPSGGLLKLGCLSFCKFLDVINYPAQSIFHLCVRLILFSVVIFITVWLVFYSSVVCGIYVTIFKVYLLCKNIKLYYLFRSNFS
jgi:hypothetical protein